MQDPTPAVFITEAAANAAARVCVERDHVRKAVVLPYTERGAMTGWCVKMHFVDHYRRTELLANAEVPL